MPMTDEERAERDRLRGIYNDDPDKLTVDELLIVSTYGDETFAYDICYVLADRLKKAEAYIKQLTDQAFPSV